MCCLGLQMELKQVIKAYFSLSEINVDGGDFDLEITVTQKHSPAQTLNLVCLNLVEHIFF